MEHFDIVWQDHLKWGGYRSGEDIDKMAIITQLEWITRKSFDQDIDLKQNLIW